MAQQPKITPKFLIGKKVHLRHDLADLTRFVTAITERQTGYVYELTGYDLPAGPLVSWHYDFEIESAETPEPRKTKR